MYYMYVYSTISLLYVSIVYPTFVWVEIKQ